MKNPAGARDIKCDLAGVIAAVGASLPVQQKIAFAGRVQRDHGKGSGVNLRTHNATGFDAGPRESLDQQGTERSRPHFTEHRRALPQPRDAGCHVARCATGHSLEQQIATPALRRNQVNDKLTKGYDIKPLVMS